MTSKVSMAREEDTRKTYASALLLMSLVLTAHWSELVIWSISVAKESGKYSFPLTLGKNK